ncbi:MAG: anaerobic sulfatase maturase [Chthonomonadales bacterium]
MGGQPSPGTNIVADVRRRRPIAFHVMTKPIGPACNLDCAYCFYLEKEALLRSEGRALPGLRMPDPVLETYIREYIRQQDVDEISFAWQGGEPTLLGVDFFRRVVELQQRYSQGKRIHNALQTNATLLDDAWGSFLAENRFLVGVSLDGPQQLHDAYRVTRHGEPTFHRVMAGIEILKRHGVEFNLLTVVHRINSRAPLEVYRFLRNVGSGFIQFIPLVERVRRPGLQVEGRRTSFASPDDAGACLHPSSVLPEDWGSFLCAVFDEWVRCDVGRVFVNLFDVALGQWLGEGSSLCVFAERCGEALAMEHNGDLYSCDHYVYPAYRLGNILDTPLRQMVFSEFQRGFGNAKRDALPRMCRECPVLFACNGECPKHRFLTTPDGEPGLNYLCSGYRRFFTHIGPAMRVMADLCKQGRAPAEIMRIGLTAAPGARRVGRNDPCPCGSGLKYKRCCLPGKRSPAVEVLENE